MEVENNKQVFHPVEIREIITRKNPKLGNRIPGFIYYLLSKILHLKKVNELITETNSNSGLGFISEVIKKSDSQYEIFGLENVPKSGKFIFASNHPLGGLDGLILLKIINENFGKTQTIINDFLMEVGPLREFFIPINKVGKQARNTAPLIEELYKSESQILIFPAGLCSRKVKGEIRDLEWRKHFVQKAIENKRNIIPVYFEGRNSNFFYNFANLRKSLNIKFNAEMILLADEMFKISNRRFKISFGKPILYESLDNSKKPIEWANEIKNIVYSLRS